MKEKTLKLIDKCICNKDYMINLITNHENKICVLPFNKLAESGHSARFFAKHQR